MACDVLDLDPAAAACPATYDVVVCVGNVLVYLAEDSERRGAAAAAVAAGPGRAAARGLPPRRRAPRRPRLLRRRLHPRRAAAGLRVEHRFGSYALHPPTATYGVWVLVGHGRAGPSQGPGLRSVDLGRGQGVDDRLGHRLRLVLLGQADLGVGTAAVVEGDTTRPSSLASPLAQTPKVSESGPASRTRKPQLQQWSGAAWASGDDGPPSPSYQRSAASVATLGREHAHPAEAELAGHEAHLGALVVVEGVVAEGPGRDQARVVVVHRQQVARATCHRAGSARGRAPRPGARIAWSPGHQHDLVDGDVLLVGGAGHGDRPVQPT